MARKSDKVPRLFAEVLPARVFEERILKRVYIPSDREFLQGLYQREQGGGYRRPTGLEPEVARRLRELAGAVSRNKGVVRAGKLSVIAVIVAAVLGFNLFFRDRLAERGLEKALEGIFSARAEIDGLRLRLLRGAVSFHHLAVADEQQPMRNLFELGRSSLSLDPLPLLRGRVVVRSMHSRDVRWDTPRRSSGALEPREEEAEDEQERTRDRRGLLPGLDAAALLEEQAGNLRSPGAAAGLSARAEEAERRWTGRVEQSEQTLRRLADQVQALRELEVGALDTVAEAQAALARLRALAPALQGARSQLTEVQDGLSADARELSRSRIAVQDALDADLAYLASLTDLSGEAFRGVLASIAAPYLQRALGRFSGLAQRALEYGSRLAARGLSAAKSGKAEGAARGRSSGREVVYPVRRYPRFLLQSLEATVGEPGEAYHAGLSVQNLSSDPDLTGAPILFTADVSRVERSLGVAGGLDLRSGARERLSAALESYGQPLELSEGLEEVSLRRVAGRYDLRCELNLRPGGEFGGAGRLSLRDIALEMAPEGGAVGAAVYEVLSGAPELVVAFRYGSEGGRLRVSAETNLDELLGRKLQQGLAEVGSQYEQRLRAELDRRLERELARSDSLASSLAALQSRTGGNLQDLGEYEKLLAGKRAELEARVRRLGGQTLRGLTETLPLR